MSALTLVVLVVIGEGGHKKESTASLKRAAEQTLGADTSVIVRDVSRLPGDDEAVALERSLHADAVAEVAWNDAEPPAAHVHLHIASSSRWVDRDIGFSSSDVAAEQGRTLGFAMASMLPERPPPVISVLPVAPAPTPESDRAAVAPPRAWRGSITASAVGHGSVGGVGGGLGGAIAVEWFLTPNFALRGGVHARYADVEVAQATSLIVTTGVGLTWHAWNQSPTRRFGIGARVDAIAMYQSLTHLDDDDTSPVHQSRWLPAADAAIEGSWLFTESASLVVATGAEVAFGTTDVVTHHVEVTSLDPVHLFVELGIRTRF